MRPRYTKRVREEAALICAIAASTPGLRDAYGEVYRALRGRGERGIAFELAIDAWMHADYADFTGPRDAEAEALIRSGWSPE